MNKHTPKHFVLQLSSLLAAYVSVVALVILLFNLINITFPDAVEHYYQAESARAALRGAIATLIVFFPAFLVLTRISNQTRRKESGGEYTVLGRWLVYLSLGVIGGALLVDLVTLILFFLNGEITVRFILKVMTLATVIKLAGFYYLLDVRGYFKQRVTRAYYFAALATVLVLAALVVGLANIETPAEVREQRLDDQQIGHLQDMQWRIEDYYRSNEVLPETLNAVYTVVDKPTAPENRPNYRYEVTGGDTFSLCATFASSNVARMNDRSLAYPSGLEKNNNWEHTAGEWCFEREIDGEYRQ